MQQAIADANNAKRHLGDVFRAVGAGALFEPSNQDGEDVEIDPGMYYMCTRITLRNPVYTNLKHGDKLWFAATGAGVAGTYVSVFSQFVPNRNYGPPNALRRSNTAAIGYMSRDDYMTLMISGGRGWARLPNVGQHRRTKYQMKVVQNVHRYNVQGGRASQVTCVVYWR